jgi:4-hydroxy-2-oxoheptanedioate aldolase
MRPNSIRAALTAGRAVIGSFAWTRSTAAIEIFGHLGFDFVVIDTEHAATAQDDVEHMVRAAEAVGIAPIVRVAELNRAMITRVLDSGAAGVIIPQIHSAADAQYAVQAAKYHPLGRRGMALPRASGFGLTGGDTYYEDANRETLLIVQVENRDAVEHLPSILAVPGIDVVLIGPMDLSQSLGYPGQHHLPVVRTVIERIIQQTRDHGLPAGIGVMDVNGARHWRDAGCRFLLVGADVIFLANAARTTLDEWQT